MDAKRRRLARGAITWSWIHPSTIPALATTSCSKPATQQLKRAHSHRGAAAPGHGQVNNNDRKKKKNRGKKVISISHPAEHSSRLELPCQFSYEHAMSGPAPPTRPGLPWRLASAAVMGSVGALSRGFLYGLNNVEVTGLSNLLRVLDRRKDVENRQRGLLTVCNHVAVYVQIWPLHGPQCWFYLELD